MEYAAKAMRSIWRPANLAGQPGTQLRTWYRITNAASAALPTQVSIYDEIGYFGVAAGEFMADLKAINGDIELHINSPGGDVHDGLAIFNQLKQRKGAVHVIIDGLAASAASFIAMAASPGQLEMAPHSQMMVHNGFSMSIGDADDLRKTADLLDMITTEIASIYAERSGKPVDYWLGKMSAETWFTDVQAVAEGLADGILGQAAPKAEWDLSVYGHAPFADWEVVDETGDTAPRNAAEPPEGDDDGPDCPTCKGAGKIMDGHRKCPDCNGTGKGTGKDPDGDGDDDTTAEGDTDHDYVKPDGSPGPKAGNLAGMFPVLAAEVDSSPWDASKAWAAGAASDDPAKFYAGICAGRKAGDASTQGAWALPYKYSPSSAPNAAGVKNALARLPQTQGLTNKAEAEATLQKAMKSVNPDYDPDALLDPAVIASAFTVPAAEVDLADWDGHAVLKAALASADPAWYFRSVCAGRLPGDPATAAAWALPYRRTPSSPPNAAAVRTALAELPFTERLANAAEARTVLDTAMRRINPAYEPDDSIDPDLLVAAFAIGLKGAGK